MEHQPIILLDIPSKVFEVSRRGQTWPPADQSKGIRVDVKKHLFSEFTCSFKFTVPAVLRQGDSWNFIKVTRAADCAEEVIVDITYEPDDSQVSVLMNAGNQGPELTGVVMKDISPAELQGRVFECYVEINQDRIFASIHNRFVGGGGDLGWSAMAPSTGGPRRPWNGSPNGLWRVSIGTANAMRGSRALPPGFGLSDLRVSLAAAHDTFLDSLPYRGALDHLLSATPEPGSRWSEDRPASAETVSLPEDLSDWDHPTMPLDLPDPEADDMPDLEDPPEPDDVELAALELEVLELVDSVEVPLSRVLQQFAAELHCMSGTADSWARRAASLADETEHLAFQLPEEDLW